MSGAPTPEGLDLDAIEARAFGVMDVGLGCRHLVERDVPALLAEVRRLTQERDVALRERDEARASLTEVRAQRDALARVREGVAS